MIKREALMPTELNCACEASEFKRSREFRHKHACVWAVRRVFWMGI